MSAAVPITNATIAALTDIRARLTAIEAKLDALIELAPRPKTEEPWRCGCWPAPMGAPPGVECKGCGTKNRWRQ